MPGPDKGGGRVGYPRAVPADAQLLQRSVYVMRWADMDAFGHLNNACYFTYFEQVRVDWLGGIGAGHELVLANVSCTFVAPVKFPATLEVRLYAGRPGRSSLDTWYEMIDQGSDGGLCALGHGTIVWYDHAAGRSVPIPDAVRERLPH